MKTNPHKRAYIKISHGVGVRYKMTLRQAELMSKKYLNDVFILVHYYCEERKYQIHTYNNHGCMSSEQFEQHNFLAEIKKILSTTVTCEQILYLEANLSSPGSVDISLLATDCIANIPHQSLVFFTETERLIETLRLDAKNAIHTSKVFESMTKALEQKSRINCTSNITLDGSSVNHNHDCVKSSTTPLVQSNQVPSLHQTTISTKSYDSDITTGRTTTLSKRIINDENTDSRLAENTESTKQQRSERKSIISLSFFFSCFTSRHPTHSVLPENAYK